MKAYKVELLVIDHDNIGENSIRNVIENANYPNDCIWPKVKYIECKEIGEWSDSHPLNKKNKQDEEYNRLFKE